MFLYEKNKKNDIASIKTVRKELTNIVESRNNLTTLQLGLYLIQYNIHVYRSIPNS